MSTLILYFILGGIAGRIRGGALKDEISEMGTTHGRLVWALTIAVIVLYESFDITLALSFGVMALVGVFHGYLKGKFDLGLRQNRNMKNYTWLTLSAVLRVLPMALISLFIPCIDVFIFGMLASLTFVPCYLAGNILHKVYKGIGHTQYGEFLFYGIVAASIGMGIEC